MVQENPATKNLIPMNKRTKSEQTRIARMGGKANKGNPKSILANKLAKLKQFGKKADEADMKWIIEKMFNPEMDVFDMQRYLNTYREQLSPKDALQLQGMIHKLHHGEKHKVQSVNVNIDMNADDVKEHLAKVFEDMGGEE